MAKETSIAVKTREALFESMPKKLQAVAKRLDEQLATEATGRLKICYDSGAMIRAVLEDEAGYGTGAVEKLAEYLGKHPTELYNRRTVVESFTRDEVIALAQRQMANGNHLTPSHLICLARVKKASDQKRLIERCFNESLSAETLAREVQAGIETKNKRFGGRKPSKPSSPLAAAQQIFQQCQGVKNRFPGWQDSLLEAIDDMEPEKIANPVLLEKMEKAMQTVEELEGELTNFHGNLQKKIKRVSDAVERQKKAEDAAKKQNKKEERQLEGTAKSGK